MAASALSTRKIQVREGMRISFTYKKLDGTMKTVDDFLVDRIYTSNDGQRIVQGWRADGAGRSYRRYRMGNVKAV